ncbi:MAG: hypothetical protein LIP09_07580 [Bacteroidales bacterium]|nr:hypothetical protein [Bacteroidales bacterium]
MNFTIDDFEAGKAYIVEWRYVASAFFPVDVWLDRNQRHESVVVRTSGVVLKKTDHELVMAMSAIMSKEYKFKMAMDIQTVPIPLIERVIPMPSAIEEFNHPNSDKHYAISDDLFSFPKRQQSLIIEDFITE